MSPYRVFAIITLFLTAPCVTSQKVSVEFDRSVNFSGFLTYTWARGAQSRDLFVDRLIINGVDRRLSDAGLQRVEETGDPELVVVYYVATDAGIEVDTTNLAGWGGGWGWKTDSAPSTTSLARNLAVGELEIHIAQVKGKRLVWRAVATGTIGDRRDRIQKMVNQALDKMFERFPPAFGK
jgi:hypothetical protein